MGPPFRRDEGLVFLSRRHVCCTAIPSADQEIPRLLQTQKRYVNFSSSPCSSDVICLGLIIPATHGEEQTLRISSWHDFLRRSVISPPLGSSTLLSTPSPTMHRQTMQRLAASWNNVCIHRVLWFIILSFWLNSNRNIRKHENVALKGCHFFYETVFWTEQLEKALNKAYIWFRIK
jgi:hypothetical protein